MSAPPSIDNSTPASPWVLFGIDLSTVGQDWLKAMRQLYQVAPLRWFELNPPIQVLRSNGQPVVWQSGQWHTSSDATASAQEHSKLFTAIELPETMVLRRVLNLPALPDAQIQDAVALDLLSSSPFSADDMAWGYIQTNTESGVQTHAAFASRTQIAQFLDKAATQHAWPSTTSEVWVFTPDSTQPPIIFQGYGEAIAEKARNQRRLHASVALLLLAGLLLAAAITPTLQVRQQAIQADLAYQQLQAQTAQLSAERAQFTKALEGVAQIKNYNEQRINPLEVLELLSDVLPDDVSVISLKIEDQNVELTAEADNAAAIIQALEELEPFAEVRTTRPVQQVAQAKKERFTVEMRIAPGAFNVKFNDEQLLLPQPEPESAAGTADNDVDTTPEEQPVAATTGQHNTAAPTGSSTAVIGGSSTAVIGGSTSRRSAPSDSSGVAPPPVPPQPLKPQPLPTTPSADIPADQAGIDAEEPMEQDEDVDSDMADEENPS